MRIYTTMWRPWKAVYATNSRLNLQYEIDTDSVVNRFYKPGTEKSRRCVLFQIILVIFSQLSPCANLTMTKPNPSPNSNPCRDHKALMLITALTLIFGNKFTWG